LLKLNLNGKSTKISRISFPCPVNINYNETAGRAPAQNRRVKPKSQNGDCGQEMQGITGNPRNGAYKNTREIYDTQLQKLRLKEASKT